MRCGWSSGLLLLAAAAAAAPAPRFPGARAFDGAMRALISKHGLPGGQLAVAADGRLLLSRGYGYADIERRQRVRPDSLFRIGSVSKTLTAVAILTLVDRGLLRLDDKAFRILDHLAPASARQPDPRFGDITIQDLLQHAAGWDSAIVGDPLSQAWAHAEGIRIDPPAPPDGSAVIRIMLTQPLHFDQIGRAHV